MSSGRQTVKDLIDEAKKRVVLLLVSVFGLAYLMSLTSSSVWVNLPAAAALIIFGRYISLDLDSRKKIAPRDKLSTIDQPTRKNLIELHKFPLEKPNWRWKVNSPTVEAAIEQFTRHLVSEWITDLWYSRITPDRDGPEELIQIINNVLGEIAFRARDINLINLLTRDIIDLVCNHLELYRLANSKLKQQVPGKSPINNRDTQLRLVLAADNKLHPALFSAEAEHKVLQHLMNGLILVTFRPEDLQCSFFRYVVRELLACAVFRPVLNLACPRVINEKIEAFVLFLNNKANNGGKPSADETLIVKPPANPMAGHVSEDSSAAGVELVQVRRACSSTAADEKSVKYSNGTALQKDLPNPANARTKNAGGEWAHMLDAISRRKTQVLAPEHLESVWTKGRNYKKKDEVHGDNQVEHGASVGRSDTPRCFAEQPNLIQDNLMNSEISRKSSGSSYNGGQSLVDHLHFHSDSNGSTHHAIASYEDIEELSHEEVDADSESPYQTEDEDNNAVTGLHSPGTKVWDSRNKTAAVPHIRHPLETSEVHSQKGIKGNVYQPRPVKTSVGRKRPKSRNVKVPIWQEVERTSFLLGEGRDILHEAKYDAKSEDLSDEPEAEIWGRIHSGGAATSSLSSISTSESCLSPMRSPENSVLADSFLKLKCEVLGANIVKSGTGTFAVYSIAVSDANNNSWSIKRRYRHFEELHRRLKEFHEYKFSLPPKHYLSSGLDVPVIHERCYLLDKYLKMLLQSPTISGSIEVWDFLSVDSQTYMFSDSLSIIQTLSVNLDDKLCEKGTRSHSSVENINCHLSSTGENLSSVGKQYSVQVNKNFTESDSLGLRKRNIEQTSGKNGRKEIKNSNQDNSGSDSEYKLQKKVSSSSTSDMPRKAGVGKEYFLHGTTQILETADDSSIPTEWVPPNLSVPILNLIDVVFQLQDGGWIRRQAFWVAKQLLQLGMGDAFDDWLIEKIQLLRKGTIIASAINRVEQILWPDGIFLTKHPNRKSPPPVHSPNHNKVENILTSEQQLEAARRAEFVYELMIDKAPATLVSLVGGKEYERCTQDIYFFLQSPLCLKQLAFELLELILLSLFPELDDVVRKCHEEKEQFGVVESHR